MHTCIFQTGGYKVFCLAYAIYLIMVIFFIKAYFCAQVTSVTLLLNSAPRKGERGEASSIDH